jgi:broad specificity phosphatase PhoE
LPFIDNTVDKTTVTRIVLIRHGQAIDVAGRCIGHTDVALSEEGAAAIRHMAANVSRQRQTRLVSSDLQRASESARIISLATGCHLEIDARLREMNFGAWDGRTWDEILRDDSERLGAWMERWTEIAAPAGESAHHLLLRAAHWLDELAAQERHGDQIVVVSHAGWIRAAITHMLGYDIARMFEIPADHARATIVDLATSGYSLVASNVDSLPLINDAR